MLHLHAHPPIHKYVHKNKQKRAKFRISKLIYVETYKPSVQVRKLIKYFSKFHHSLKEVRLEITNHQQIFIEHLPLTQFHMARTRQEGNYRKWLI